jgi:hypothetical protein
LKSSVRRRFGLCSFGCRRRFARGSPNLHLALAAYAPVLPVSRRKRTVRQRGQSAQPSGISQPAPPNQGRLPGGGV